MPGNRTLTKHVEDPADQADGAHRVVNPAAAEPGLRDDERATARTEHVIGGNPDILVPHITLAAPAAERLVAEPDITQHVDARRLRGHDEHRMTLIRRGIGIRHRHHDQKRRHRRKRREPLLAVDHPVIAVLDRAGGELLRIRATLWLGHREAGDDPIVQQRLEITLLEFGSAVVGQNLAVPGIRCLRTEDDRGAFGAAEYFVEQRQLHLAVSGSTQVRAQVGRPQPAFLDDLLQRRYQRLAHRVVEVVRLLDDQVNWLTFRTHELVNPLELPSPFRVSREVPSHRSSFRYSVATVRRALADHAGIGQLGDRAFVESQSGQHGPGVVAGQRRRSWRRRRGARKPWRRCGLRHAVDLDERLPRDVVRMARRLSDRQYRGGARPGCAELLLPLGTRLL